MKIMQTRKLEEENAVLLRMPRHTWVSLAAELLRRSNSRSVSVRLPFNAIWEPLPKPFIMVPFSVGPGPHFGCQIAPPIKWKYGGNKYSQITVSVVPLRVSEQNEFKVWCVEYKILYPVNTFLLRRQMDRHILYIERTSGGNDDCLRPDER